MVLPLRLRGLVPEEEEDLATPPLPALQSTRKSHDIYGQLQQFDPRTVEQPFDLGSQSLTAPQIMQEKFREEELARVAAEEQAAKDRIWATYPEDVGSKKDKYLSTLEEIQGKARQLNMIAGLTGGTSQASSFTANALEQLDKIMDFDDKERLQQIGYALNWTKDGAYDPPKTRKEAQERAIKLGASPTEASTLAGFTPEQKQFVNWRNTNPNSSLYGKELSAPVGEGPTSDRATISGIESAEDWVRIGGAKDEGISFQQQFENDLQNLVDSDDMEAAFRLAQNRFLNDAYSRGKELSPDAAMSRSVNLIQSLTDKIAPGMHSEMEPAQEALLKEQYPNADYFILNGELMEFSSHASLQKAKRESDKPGFFDMGEPDLSSEWSSEYESLTPEEKGAYTRNPSSLYKTFNEANILIDGTPEWADMRKNLINRSKQGFWIPSTLVSKYRLNEDSEFSDLDQRRDEEETLFQIIRGWGKGLFD